MRFKFLILIFILYSCGKDFSDGYMDCTNIKRDSGNMNISDNSLIEAIGNYARVKAIRLSKNYVDPDVFNKDLEDKIAKDGIALRRTFAVAVDDLTTYPDPINKFVGVCCRNNNKIIIDKDRWGRYPQEQKNLLMMHELGHCDLNRTHVDQKLAANSINQKNEVTDEVETSEKINKSIMHPILIAPYMYEPRKTYYDRELFAR